MTSIRLSTPGDTSSIRELTTLLAIKGCDGSVIYELHNHHNPERKEPDPEFINRSTPYYPAFINSSMVDQWASDDISYAAKIDGVWYFAVNACSNTYIGSGPMSAVRLREFCFKNGIKILYIEKSFEEWYTESLNPRNTVSVMQQQEEARTIAQSYNEVNLIIVGCGEGIARITNTAAKLHEPNYRDLFLATFCTHKNFIVDSESQIRNGRTDLKVHDRILNIPYIYEFKIHNNNSDIEEALSQITKRYATVNNRYNGIVILNKKDVNLSDLVAKIKRILLDSDLTINEIKVLDPEHKLIVDHCHILDSNTNCILTIFIFDIRDNILT